MIEREIFLFFRHFFLFPFANIIIGGGSIKKNIGIILLALMLSLVFSKALFTTYQNEQVMASDGNLYLLQYGSYINKEVMNKNIEKLKNYLIYQEENKYYVYVGAYTIYENALNMQKKFEEEGIYTYIKNDYYGDSNKLQKIKVLEQNLIEKNTKEKIEINTKILDILQN